MKIKNYILSLFLIGTLAGCSDFLDREPLDAIARENFFVTEDDAIAAVTGAYQPLQWPKLYNMRMWTTDIMAGNSIVGAGGGEDGRETQDQANFVTTTDNPGVLDLFQGPSPGILRANIVLKEVPKMNIREEIKNRVIGEALFLRAHYYFILVRFFGDIPLILEPQGAGDDFHVSRTPKDQVYVQIIKDLEQAIELLPRRETYTGSNVGRASKGSAVGMLAKVHLTLGNWSKVVELCNEVEVLGYALNPDYAQNFDPTGGNTIESLFEVQYFGKTNHGFWSDLNQASWLSAFTGPRGSGMVHEGWGWNQPTEEFVNSYEPGDKRKDVTVLYEGGPPFDGMNYESSYSSTGYNLRKFLVPKSITLTFDNSPMNFPVLRYADVLLMKAEALNEMGLDGHEPLNQVRRRAGLNDLANLSQSEFREKVLHERRMELAFEGQRWFDLIRVNNGQYGLNFLHSIGKTNATTTHLLFPIPQRERDANPNLTQNQGY